MKFSKIFAFILAATAIVACSNGDYKPEKPDYNTKGGVTVSLEDAELSFLETTPIVKVPVIVEGERNGYVTVTCMVKEYGDNVAMEDVHYLMTSQTINIDTMDTSGYFEIKLVDDEDENPDRKFELTLVSANGATISGLTNTIVTLKDNDGHPYLRMAGIWHVSGYDDSGAAAKREIHIEAYDEGTAGFNNFYHITGLVLNGQNDVPAKIKADFNWDEVTKEGSISIAYDQDLPNYDHPSYGVGKGFLAWLAGNNLSTRGAALYTWGSDARVLTLESWPGDGQYPYPGADFSYLLEFDAGIMLYDDFSGVYTITRDEQ